MMDAEAVGKLLEGISQLNTSVKEMKEQEKTHYEALVLQTSSLSTRLNDLENSGVFKASATSRESPVQKSRQLKKEGKGKSRRVSFGNQSFAQQEHNDYMNEDVQFSDEEQEALMTSIDEILEEDDFSDQKVDYLSTMKGILLTIKDHSGKECDSSS